MTPKVTVYITNHNYGRYIDQAIQSVLNQDFKDFELIIIDDGSTDNSMEVISKYEPLDQVFVIQQKNRGLNITNNIALKQAQGDYIMRLDADDFLDPHALKLMVSKFDDDSDVALVFPDYYEVDEEGGIITQVRRHNFEKDVTLMDQPAHGACTMIRRRILLEIGGYDENFNRQDGYDLWLNIINNYPVKNINLPLFYYRQHTNSLTKDETQLLETRSKIIKKHVNKKKVEPISILAVIPVRGPLIDAQSLPLKVLGQKPLIDWTIDTALKSSTFQDVLVTTPDESVLEYVKDRYGTTILYKKRDINMARINQKLFPTLFDAMITYGEVNTRPDALMILNIEAPFRSAIYVDKAVNIMQLYDVDSVIATRLDDEIFFVHDGSGLKPRLSENGLRLERDDLYRKVGGLTLVKTDFLVQKEKMFGGKIGHIQLDQKAAFVIRNEFDWGLAENMVNK